MDIRCIKKGCNGEVKYNGWGNFRCRKCDTEFRLVYDPTCKHEFETANKGQEGEFTKCRHCGEEKS